METSWSRRTSSFTICVLTQTNHLTSSLRYWINSKIDSWLCRTSSSSRTEQPHLIMLCFRQCDNGSREHHEADSEWTRESRHIRANLHFRYVRLTHFCLQNTKTHWWLFINLLHNNFYRNIQGVPNRQCWNNFFYTETSLFWPQTIQYNYFQPLQSNLTGVFRG